MGIPRQKLCKRGHELLRHPDQTPYCPECNKITRRIRRERRGGSPRFKHGLSVTSTYAAWRNAKDRCSDTDNANWDNYGGRGIRMCDEWCNSFAMFVEHMGIKPPGMSLGRIDNDDGYRPGNCRWESNSQQGRNRRTNNILHLDGIQMTIVEWSETVGIPAARISQRLRSGWSIRDALSVPVVRGQKRIKGE